MLSGEVGVCKSASLLERDFFQAAADVRCSQRSLRTCRVPAKVFKIQRPHWAATPSSSAAMPWKHGLHGLCDGIGSRRLRWACSALDSTAAGAERTESA